MKEREFETTIDFHGLRISCAGVVDESGMAGIETIYDITGAGKPGSDIQARDLMAEILELLEVSHPGWADEVLYRERIAAQADYELQEGLRRWNPSTDGEREAV